MNVCTKSSSSKRNLRNNAGNGAGNDAVNGAGNDAVNGAVNGAGNDVVNNAGNGVVKTHMEFSRAGGTDYANTAECPLNIKKLEPVEEGAERRFLWVF